MFCREVVPQPDPVVLLHLSRWEASLLVLGSQSPFYPKKSILLEHVARITAGT